MCLLKDSVDESIVKYLLSRRGSVQRYGHDSQNYLLVIITPKTSSVMIVDGLCVSEWDSQLHKTILTLLPPLIKAQMELGAIMFHYFMGVRRDQMCNNSLSAETNAEKQPLSFTIYAMK